VNSKAFVSDVLRILNRTSRAMLEVDLALHSLVAVIQVRMVMIAVVDIVLVVKVADIGTEAHHLHAVMRMIMIEADMGVLHLVLVARLMTILLPVVVVLMILIVAIILLPTLMSMVMVDLLHETTLPETTLPEKLDMLIMIVVAAINHFHLSKKDLLLVLT